jgi:hypothetical protein
MNAITQELLEALEALCGMWNQYCSGAWGHEFMSAGENCADVLDKYQLLKNDKGTGGEVDWDKLELLKQSIE